MFITQKSHLIKQFHLQLRDREALEIIAETALLEHRAALQLILNSNMEEVFKAASILEKWNSSNLDNGTARWRHKQNGSDNNTQQDGVDHPLKQFLSKPERDSVRPSSENVPRCSDKPSDSMRGNTGQTRVQFDKIQPPANQCRYCQPAIVFHWQSACPNNPTLDTYEGPTPRGKGKWPVGAKKPDISFAPVTSTKIGKTPQQAFIHTVRAKITPGHTSRLWSMPEIGTAKMTTTVRSSVVTRKTSYVTREEVESSNKLRNSSPEKTTNLRSDPAVYTVFISLLLDLLAFTMILPLLPSLLDHYRTNDSPDSLYPWLLSKVKYFQQLVGAPDRFNSVLFGGFLGSMFSFLQFLASPLVGGVSDVYGRKPVLLICLVGIALSYVLWAVSSCFALFVLARVVGGISKGNVSLSMAIITDVSSTATRGRGMALVGIAFSVGFILGPVIGAVFAQWSHSQSGAWYVYPAMFALSLVILDIIFVFYFFKESLPKDKRAKSVASSISEAAAYINALDLFKFRAVQNMPSKDLRELRRLGFIYFVYLFLYSGLEFTITFLTHHKFNYTSMQQGWMFFTTGFTMAMVQGSYIRRLPQDKMRSTAVKGLLLIVPSYVCIGLAPSPVLLYVGLIIYSVSTALVVPCLTTLVSNHGSHEQKGKVMGIFRSLGALARALGPVVASIAYWIMGPTPTYLMGAAFLVWPWLMLKNL
ncbi:hypothetical protein PR048_024505 [Dryococelus australis]|uniref:Major facilitator superfamily (MFS) profile domain-containing protein n=1 Tax=Dryococelus australis TaxID=614101 RepID=A0ABQ9GNV0_9NEOP|nr:hypothetical protein PR048_024505 [Dryococelus australis]